jgi:dTDP-4-dehydrorhamnose reductase
MNNIIVFGASGQLGQCIKSIVGLNGPDNVIFLPEAEADILDTNNLERIFGKYKPAYVINCAAYTAVDKAESEVELAYKVNADGAGILALVCAEINCRYVHISTDFVFDGANGRPLVEDDSTNPLSVYGASKLEGEKFVMNNNPDAIIFRTSWVYSSFGSNFVKTILRLCREREQLSIIADQIGSPTYARDLAEAILDIIQRDEWHAGIYHFGNEGVASWYDFAIAIRDMAGLQTNILPIETYQYPTPAKRPKYSVLNKRKFKETFNREIPYWRTSLENCVKLING